jgi:hypothetical protein
MDVMSSDIEAGSTGRARHASAVSGVRAFLLTELGSVLMELDINGLDVPMLLSPVPSCAAPGTHRLLLASYAKFG